MSNKAFIGIIGGGQLARMSTQAAQQMGFAVAILDPDPDCPAAQVTPHIVVGRIDDPAALKALARHCEIITLENEWVKPEHLRMLEEMGVSVYPSAQTVGLIGDKFDQRDHFARVGLPVPEARPIAGQAEARSLAGEWGYPMVLKARLGGYDGYGVRIVRSEEEWASKFTEGTAGAWYAERFVPFAGELAVMVAHNRAGATSVYPVVESAQTSDGHRCDWVMAPAANIGEEARIQAAHVAVEAVRSIEGVGIFGIELFHTADGGILINEIAPRPHNSGHYTMDCCATSQFAQHIRAVTGLTLGPTHLLSGGAAMANLLGQRNEDVDLRSNLSEALAAVPGAKVHWYGKRDARKGRKMGHINVLADTPVEALSLAQAARTAFWKQSSG
jgi:5-(carboxyamino)imidazole ribonucleotide synthase